MTFDAAPDRGGVLLLTVRVRTTNPDLSTRTAPMHQMRPGKINAYPIDAYPFAMLVIVKVGLYVWPGRRKWRAQSDR